jgi:hypothetical protein
MGELGEGYIYISELKLQTKKLARAWFHGTISKQMFVLFLDTDDSINSDFLWLRFRRRLWEANSQYAVHHGRFDILIL